MEIKKRKTRADGVPLIPVTSSVNLMCATFPAVIPFFAFVFAHCAEIQRCYLRDKAHREQNKAVIKATNDANREYRVERWNQRMQDPDYVAKERERGKQKFQDSKQQIYARIKRVRETNPGFVIAARLYCRLNQIVRHFSERGKEIKTSPDLVGCSAKELCAHLEKQFKPGMKWNPRNFEIDHIRPISTFDLTDPEQQKQCFNYSNLQPLFRPDNMAKGNKWC